MQSLRINVAKVYTVIKLFQYTTENPTTNKLRDNHQITKSVVSQLES